MDAFRAFLGCTCSSSVVASDPEAQQQHGYALPQDCAGSTIALTLYRGTVYSRHDDLPPPSVLPRPDDTPPAYTYPPPSLPISDGDSSAAQETVIGENLYATIVALIMTVGLFAISVYFSFFHHSKV